MVPSSCWAFCFTGKSSKAPRHRRSWRRLCLAFSGATVVYGVMGWQLFWCRAGRGIVFGPNLKILDLNNFSAMMMISIVVGVLHLVLANALAAYAAWGKRKAYANLGWIAVLIGGFFCMAEFSCRDFSAARGNSDACGPFRHCFLFKRPPYPETPQTRSGAWWMGCKGYLVLWALLAMS